jgi:NADH-quinone oxidoreductase subunit C
VSSMVDSLRLQVGAHVDVDARCLAPVVREQEVVDVRIADWLTCAGVLRDAGAHYLDFLTAYVHDDDLDIVLHVGTDDLRQEILVRSHLPSGASLPSLTSVYRGANWHERELAEMFGIGIDGHPNLSNLLLPNDFHGAPLLKSYALTARVDQTWPGEVEPGAVRARRKPLPPGVLPVWIEGSVNQNDG